MGKRCSFYIYNKPTSQEINLILKNPKKNSKKKIRQDRLKKAIGLIII